jgi:hypothetical protein
MFAMLEESAGTPARTNNVRREAGRSATTAVRFGLAFIALAAGCASASRHVRKESPMRLGNTSYEVASLFEDAFDGDLSNWANLNPGTKWFIRDGSLIGEWRPGGSVIWLKPVFEGDVLVSVHAEALMPTDEEWAIYAKGFDRKRIPEGGKNLNRFLLCSGPNGERMEDCYVPLLREATGPNGCSFDQYRGYFLTFTCWWARFRYLPDTRRSARRWGLSRSWVRHTTS